MSIAVITSENTAVASYTDLLTTIQRMMERDYTAGEFDDYLKLVEARVNRAL